MIPVVPTSKRGYELYVVTIALLVFSCIILCLRVVSSSLIRKRITVSDWLILLAWTMSLGMSVALCVGACAGFGMHTQQIPEEWQSVKRKSRYAYTALYNLGLMFTKDSLLFFYLSIFSNFSNLRMSVWVTLFVVNVTGIIKTAIVLLPCNPISFVFKSDPPTSPTGENHCIDTPRMLYASAPINLITDVAILLLPMPVLSSLNLPGKQKVIISFAFFGGGFVAIVGLIGVHYFQKAVEASDFDYDGALAFMWAKIEVTVGISCASIPMLKPLVARYLPGWLGLSSHGSPPESNGEREQEHERGQAQALSTTLAGKHTPGAQPESSHRMSSLQECVYMCAVMDPWSRGGSQAIQANAVHMWEHCFKPWIVATSLFFLWGLAYGLLGLMSNKFGAVYSLSEPMVLGLHAAYFAPYFIAPLTISGYVLRIYGFKMTSMLGLGLYGIGCTMFWPTAVLGSYAGVVVSCVIMAMGLSSLEVSANAFVILCGPGKHSAARLSISQAFQALGGLVAMFMQSKKILGESATTSPRTTALADVQWIYLTIAIVAFLLVVVFYSLDLAEPRYVCESWTCSEDTTGCTCPETRLTGFSLNGREALSFALAVIALGSYTSSQEMLAVFIKAYLAATANVEEKDTLKYIKLNQGLYAAGRFLGGVVCVWILPQYVLLVFVCGCIVTTSLCMAYNVNGIFGIVQYPANRFFQSVCFPFIYALAIRRLGHHPKTASIILTSSISLAGVFPAAFAALKNATNAKFAMVLPLMGFVVCLVYPLFVIFSPSPRVVRPDSAQVGTELRDLPEDISKRPINVICRN